MHWIEMFGWTRIHATGQSMVGKDNKSIVSSKMSVIVCVTSMQYCFGGGKHIFVAYSMYLKSFVLSFNVCVCVCACSLRCRICSIYSVAKSRWSKRAICKTAKTISMQHIIRFHHLHRLCQQQAKMMKKKKDPSSEEGGALRIWEWKGKKKTLSEERGSPSSSTIDDPDFKSSLFSSSSCSL